VKNLKSKISELSLAYYASFHVNRALGGHYHKIDLASPSWFSWEWPYTNAEDWNVHLGKNKLGFDDVAKCMYWQLIEWAPFDSFQLSQLEAVVMGSDRDDYLKRCYFGESGKPTEPTPEKSAYEKCMQGLDGNPENPIYTYTGNAYMEWSLGNLEQTDKTALTVYIAAGQTLYDAQLTLNSAKSKGFSELCWATSSYWNDWLQKAYATVLTGTINYPQLYIRGLIGIKMLQEQIGPKPGSIIMAPSLQPEYCYAWPRDGTFAAVALDLANYTEDASLWYEFLKKVQRTNLDEDRELGYWYQCYHPDGSYAGVVDWYKWAGIPGLTLPLAGPESDQQGIVLWGLSVHYKYAFDGNITARDKWLEGFDDTINMAACYIKSSIWHPQIYSWRGGLLFPATDKDEEPIKFEQSIWANSAGYAGLVAASQMGFTGYDIAAKNLSESMYKIFYEIGELDKQSILKTLSYEKGESRIMLGIREPSKTPLKSTDFTDALALDWPYSVHSFDSAIEGWYTQIGTSSNNWKMSDTTWNLLFFTIYSAIHSDLTVTDYYTESLKIPVLSATTTALISEGCTYMPKYDGLHDSWGKNFADGRRAIGLVWSEAMFVIASLAKTDQFKVTVHSPADLHLYDPYHQHTGLNYTSGLTEEGIPYSDYTGRQEPQSIVVTFPIKGTYVIKLVGTDDGPYELDIALSKGGTTTTISYTGTISKGAILTFTIDTSTPNPGLIPDKIPPKTTLTIGEPKYTTPQGTTFVSSITSFMLSAIDNLDGTGVVSTFYRLYNNTYTSAWAEYTEPFNLTNLSDGEYLIDYYSVDIGGNTEPTNTATVILDNTSPTTTLNIGEPKYTSDKIYVTPDTPFTLEATDIGSGVYSIVYRIYNASYDSGWQTYTAPFTLTSLNDGTYTIEYYSIDNVQNIGATNGINVTLFSWNYIFEDSYGRGTVLKINIKHELFQFITPDKDYDIRKATCMKQCGRTIIISHRDKQLCLITVCVDTKLDFCHALAWDLQTRKCYILIDKPGIEK